MHKAVVTIFILPMGEVSCGVHICSDKIFIYIYIYIYIVKMPNSTALLPHICLHFETKVRSLYCVLLYPLAL